MQSGDLSRLWDLLAGSGFSPAAVAELLDSGMKRDLHAILADPSRPRRDREALAEALKLACGVRLEDGSVAWPVALLVAASVPAGTGGWLPLRMEALARALEEGAVRRALGLDGRCEVRVSPVLLVPDGDGWFPESSWRRAAVALLAGGFRVPEGVRVGWRRIAFPPLCDSENLAGVLVAAVRAGGEVPRVRDVGPVTDVWATATRDVESELRGRASVAVACPRPVWEMPSDATVLGASVVAGAKSVAPGTVELESAALLEKWVHGSPEEKVVSVRCDPLEVVASAHYLEWDDLLGHHTSRAAVFAALFAAVAAGGEMSVVTGSGRVVRLRLPREPGLPKASGASGVH